MPYWIPYPEVEDTVEADIVEIVMMTIVTDVEVTVHQHARAYALKLAKHYAPIHVKHCVQTRVTTRVCNNNINHLNF